MKVLDTAKMGIGGTSQNFVMEILFILVDITRTKISRLSQFVKNNKKIGSYDKNPQFAKF